MARLYANENFPFRAVRELRRLGHDVLTIQETGQAGRGVPDEEVLDFAAREGRAVLTHNRRHFIRLHRERPAHAGVVVCSSDPDPAALAQRIDEAIQAESDLAGTLLRIKRPAS